jgi:hypothetical protein
MPTRVKFQELADRRLSEAKVLLTASQYEGAFYLAGYAVECGLKAAVCNTLQTDIFEESPELQKGFKTHRLDHLIVLSGLSKRLSADAGNDPGLSLAANLFTLPPFNVFRWEGWSEEIRYNSEVCEQMICEQFVEHVEQFLVWLRKHW